MKDYLKANGKTWANPKVDNKSYDWVLGDTVTVYGKTFTVKKDKNGQIRYC